MNEDEKKRAWRAHNEADARALAALSNEQKLEIFKECLELAEQVKARKKAEP